jgi:hypothetical protein
VCPSNIGSLGANDGGLSKADGSAGLGSRGDDALVISNPRRIWPRYSALHATESDALGHHCSSDIGIPSGIMNGSMGMLVGSVRCSVLSTDRQ